MEGIIDFKPEPDNRTRVVNVRIVYKTIRVGMLGEGEVDSPIIGRKNKENLVYFSFIFYIRLVSMKLLIVCNRFKPQDVLAIFRAKTNQKTSFSRSFLVKIVQISKLFEWQTIIISLMVNNNNS